VRVDRFLLPAGVGVMPGFVYTEHGFNLTIVTLTLGFCLLATAIRIARQGSDAFSGIAIFGGIKLAEGFFITVAVIALIGVIDKGLGTLLAAHPAYAVVAAIGGLVTSIDALFDD
jgi:hypothetical protein